MYASWENAIAMVLTYVPFALLFLYAFQNSFRFSKNMTYCIFGLSVIYRIASALFADQLSSKAVIISNYTENIVMIAFGILAVKATLSRILFIGIVLKNTADAIVIFAKFAEHLVTPEWADVGYHWTYSVSLAIFEVLLLPIVYLFIKKYFTNEISDTVSRRWRVLWLIPFFFYLSWIFVFYYSSNKTDLEQACLPVNSIYLALSISCQYLIYMCIATLVQSLQNEAKLQAENHAIQVQNVQNEYIRSQIEEDRKLRHDMRHHFTTLEAFAENQEYDKLTEYLKNYVSSASWRSQIQYCSNNVLSIMTTYYANKCYSNNIDIQISLQIPEKLSISDTETAVLFGNLLENAFEACCQQGETDVRRVVFKGALINGNYLFSIENTFTGHVIPNVSGGLKSTKHQDPGLGLTSCKDIVTRHKGSIDFRYDEMFQVEILLPDTQQA